MAVLRSIENLIGNRYSFLTITKDLGMLNKHRTVSAECICGISKQYRLSHILKDKIKSCGCKSFQLRMQQCNTHKLSNHPLYTVYHGMKQRCYYEKDINFHNYGARGVTVCKEWLDSFQVFYDWAIKNGWEQGLQLDKDKLAPNGIGFTYSPQYCSFLTRKENMGYRVITKRLEYNGITKTLLEWCDLLGMDSCIVRDRIYSKWSVKDAFEMPVKKAKTYVFNNTENTLYEWCKEFNLEVTTISYRLRQGWSIEQSLSTPIRVMSNNVHKNKIA